MLSPSAAVRLEKIGFSLRISVGWSFATKQSSRRYSTGTLFGLAEYEHDVITLLPKQVRFGIEGTGPLTAIVFISMESVYALIASHAARCFLHL